MSKEICFMSATELAIKIKQRTLSPVEVVHAFLERITTSNKKINAYTTILYNQASEAARKAEQAVMSGAELGPLHGVPIAIKDLYGFKQGISNTFGSKPFKNYVSPQDAICVARLEKAGAIVLGKTNTPEFGHKGSTDNLLFGPTSTPFDLRKNAGGSSGGSAAAVAAGLAALGHGSDGGGSIRIPASFCGVYGLKASFGRVATAFRPDAFSAHTPFLHDGSLTRTVSDAALMLKVIAGPHPRDPFSLPDDGLDYLAALDTSIAGFKIAYSPNLDVFPVEQQVQSVIKEALPAFTAAGASVETVELGLNYAQDILCDIWMRQAGVLYAKMAATFKQDGVDLLAEHGHDLTPEFAALIEKGQSLSAVEYKLDNVIRTTLFDVLQTLFEKYDLLVTPTLAVPPFDNAVAGNTIGPAEVNGEKVDPLLGWCLTYPFNFTGHPAASIPAGFTVDGLPIGLQIVGRRFADDTVLAASAAFERIKPWHHTYPLDWPS